MAKRPMLTTTSGRPVADNQNSVTAGPRGPLLMEDFFLLEKLAHQNRERIPERGQHAKGSGAYGDNNRKFSEAILEPAALPPRIEITQRGVRHASQSRRVG